MFHQTLKLISSLEHSEQGASEEMTVIPSETKMGSHVAQEIRCQKKHLLENMLDRYCTLQNLSPTVPNSIPVGQKAT
jgi:hypothetical protein